MSEENTQKSEQTTNNEESGSNENPPSNLLNAVNSANTPDSPSESSAKSASHESSNNTDEWFLAPGVPGEGPKPEFFDNEKYKSILDQAKGMPGLRKMISDIEKAPADYESTFTEDFKNALPDQYKDIDIDTESDIYKDFSALAKELNIPQKAFTKILQFYAATSAEQDLLIKELADSRETLAAREEEDKNYLNHQMQELGKNANERLEAVNNWAVNNLPEELVGEDGEIFKDSLKTATNVKIMEFLMQRLQNTRMASSQEVNAQNTMNQEKLKALRSDPRFSKDTEYQKHVINEYKKMYGQN